MDYSFHNLKLIKLNKLKEEDSLIIWMSIRILSDFNNNLKALMHKIAHRASDLWINHILNNNNNSSLKYLINNQVLLDLLIHNHKFKLSNNL